jgi:hypothetical protein
MHGDEREEEEINETEMDVVTEHLGYKESKVETYPSCSIDRDSCIQ